MQFPGYVNWFDEKFQQLMFKINFFLGLEVILQLVAPVKWDLRPPYLSEGEHGLRDSKTVGHLVDGPIPQTDVGNGFR